MGLFRRSHSFKLSPLSLSVPLGGCDTVVGLQELQRKKDSDLLAKALNLSSTYGSPGKFGQRQRHGPSLSDISSKDIQQNSRPWLDFLWGSDGTSYNLCEGLSHLGQRAEENLVYWLPNYLRIFLGFSIFIMLMRPRSLLGMALLAAVALWSPVWEIYKREKGAPPKQQRRLTLGQLIWEAIQQRSSQLQAAVYRVQQQQEERQAEDSGQRQEGHQQAAASRDDLQRNWGFMACTFAAFYSGLPGVISRAAIYAALVILTHTSLRQTPSEHAIKLRNLAQNGGTHCPGVPFLEVLGLRASRNPDPRRLIKEICSSLTAISSAAGTYLWHAAQSKCLNSLRYFRK